MIKAYCYGVFADTMTDEEFYEVEKAQRECHAACRRTSPLSQSFWK